MAIKSDTLRPGLLVSMKSSTRGNVKYDKRVLEAEHITEGSTQKARWETERTIADAVEHDLAQRARSKAASLIRGVCAYSAFGLLCPEADADKLEQAIASARVVIDEFNSTAKLSKIGFYVLTGRIAPDDVEAVKAINSEVSDLMKTMSGGIENLDVKAVRDAASRAKQLASMLPVETEARVQIAIDTAREAARRIVKAGEQAAAEIDRSAIRKIEEARTSFLDLDEAKEIAAPTSEARAIDLEPSAEEDAIRAAEEFAAREADTVARFYEEMGSENGDR